MNRKLLCLSAFLLACLIGIGYLWTEKDKFGSHSDVLTIDELIRGLIRDTAYSDREWAAYSWAVFAQQEDPVKWENRYNSEGRFLINPRVGSVALARNDGKPIPGEWDILLKSDFSEAYESIHYDFFAISHDSVFDIRPGELPIQLREGERADLLPPRPAEELPFINVNSPHDLYAVQLNGKELMELLIEWPCEANGHFLGIYGKEKNHYNNVWEILEFRGKGKDRGRFQGICKTDDLFHVNWLQKHEQPVFSKGSFDRWISKCFAGEVPPHSIEFHIEKDGSITHKKCKADDTSCGMSYYSSWDGPKETEENGVRYLSEMPKWEPGKIKGKPVRVFIKKDDFKK